MTTLLSPDEMQAQQYQRDVALQNQNNSNVASSTADYNTAKTGANNAQADLTNFTKNMQNGTDIYNNALVASNKNAGYDVNNLNQAQDQVSQITGIMGGLPRAIQASNANYGATAGNVANQYATTGANLNQSLGLANQNAQNQLVKLNAGLTGAQAGAGAQITTQDQQRQAYTSTAANAAQIMQNAQQQMQAMITLQQSGQKMTADDQATFGQLKASYAAAAQAYAVANYNNAQAAQVNYSLGQQQQADAASKAAAQAAAAAKQNAAVSHPATSPTAPTNTGGALGAFIKPMQDSLGSAYHWLLG